MLSAIVKIHKIWLPKIWTILVYHCVQCSLFPGKYANDWGLSIFLAKKLFKIMLSVGCHMPWCLYVKTETKWFASANLRVTCYDFMVRSSVSLASLCQMMMHRVWSESIWKKQILCWSWLWSRAWGPCICHLEFHNGKRDINIKTLT